MQFRSLHILYYLDMLSLVRIMNQQKQTKQTMFDTLQICQNSTVNPQYSLTEPNNSSKAEETEVSSHLIDSIQSLVSLQHYQKAHQMASVHAFIKQLLLDRLQIDILSDIYSSQVGTPHFSRLKLRHPLLTPIRQTRIRGFYSLKSSKSLNITLISSLTRNLEDLIEGRYQPKTGSDMFETVYRKLNRICEMLKSAEKGSKARDSQDCGREGDVMAERNTQLGRELEVERREKMELAADKLKYLGEICEMKKQQGNFQRSMLELRQKHLSEMEQKNKQFKVELTTIRNLRKTSNIQTNSIYQELDVSIQDFKDLIIKLSKQNKILREEREILLAKLTEVYQKIETAILKQAHTDLPPSIEQKEDKLELLLAEIAAKDQTIRQFQTQLQTLRQYKAESERQKLNGSICDSSLDNSRSNIESDMGGRRRIQRTNTDKSATMLRDKERKIKELQAQIKEDNFTIQELADRVQLLQKQIETLTFNFEETIRIQEKKIGNLSEECGKLTALLKEKEEKASSLLQQQKQDAIIERNLHSMTEKMQKLQQNLKTKEMQLSEQRNTISSLNSVLNNSLPMANELVKENELLNSRIGTYTKQSKLLADSLKEREEEIRCMKDEHRRELEDLEMRLGEEKFQIIDLEGKVESLQAELDLKMEELAEKDRMIAEIEVKNYEKKYKSLILEQNFRQNHPEQHEIAILFAGSILQAEPSYKLFLKQTIEKRYSCHIRKTRPLYKLDSLNKTNFHAYIDNHPNFLLLVQLTNNFHFAVYSEGKLSPKTASDKDGVIISLTNRLVFEPAEKNRRVLTYDEFYLIVGNSEVRIRTQENLVFSNFGISNGYFKARGLKVDALLGTLEREVKMKDMEVYQVEFY